MRSCEVGELLMSRPDAMQSSNNILHPVLVCSKDAAGTHVESRCIHGAIASCLRLYPLGAMLCSNNIIRYHHHSSNGFAGTQLEFRSFEVRGLVLYRPAAKHCSNNILQREQDRKSVVEGKSVEIR